MTEAKTWTLLALEELELLVESLPGGERKTELRATLEHRRERRAEADRRFVESEADQALRRDTLGTGAACRYLGVSSTMLGQARKRGKGPPFQRLADHGRVRGGARYLIADLDAFHESRSEAKRAQALETIGRSRRWEREVLGRVESRFYGDHRGLAPVPVRCDRCRRDVDLGGYRIRWGASSWGSRFKLAGAARLCSTCRDRAVWLSFLLDFDLEELTA